MWPDAGHGNGGLGRSSTGSEVVIIDDQVPATMPPPPAARPFLISNMNLTNSPGSRIGDNYVTVTNVTHSEEVVKGRLLGLELISPAHAHRLRCSVAVCFCWAIVVASGLAIYFFYFALLTRSRIDIDVPCTKYMWAYVKNSTRAERLCCSLATLVLALCLALAVYFTLFYNKEPLDDCTLDNNAPWYISRDTWLAAAYDNSDIEASFEPLRLVIIQHSVSTECHCFMRCASELRNLQTYFINDKDRDIPYNFMIGNDGRVYEGRGWRKEGAHTKFYNRCSVGIGYIGDYREEKGSFTKVTELQQTRMNMLLEEGVINGFLHPDYEIVAAMDVQKSVSPGSNLYKVMQKWPHYDRQHRFRNKTCDVINTMPFP